MKKIIAYQLTLISLLVYCWAQGPLGNTPAWLAPYQLAINCILLSTLAGILYCIRALYTNVASTHNNAPELWYYLRPLASAVAGFAAYVFLKASIIVLEANQAEDAGLHGYMAFSFIAGYNVDLFLKKIEDLSKSTFNVDKASANQQIRPLAEPE